MQHENVDTALNQAKLRVLELLEKVAAGAGGESYPVRGGWIDSNEIEDNYYQDVTDTYKELRESIDLLFQFVEREHRTNISLAQKLGAAEERQRHQMTRERETNDTPSPARENRLWRDDKAWWVTYDGDTRKLGKLLGMLYISYALERPGPVGVKLLDIEMAVHGGTDVYGEDDRMYAHAEVAGGGFDDEGYDDEENGSAMRYADYTEITATEDRETLELYRKARRQLEGQVHTAELAGNAAQVEILRGQQKELQAEIQKLEQSTKRGPENEGAAKEHIKRVREAIRHALEQLPARHPAIAIHLDETLRIESNSAIYNPTTPTRWVIDRPREPDRKS